MCLSFFDFFKKKQENSRDNLKEVFACPNIAEACLLKKNENFSYQNCPVEMMNMDKTDPRTRPQKKEDEWFAENVESFYFDGHTMACINTYGHVTDMFIKKLRTPELNLNLQKAIIMLREIKISGSATLSPWFSNILCAYVRHYDFLPEIKAVIFNDDRYDCIKKIYCLFRVEHDPDCRYTEAVFQKDGRWLRNVVKNGVVKVKPI